jgi:hypothetical protein
VKPRSNHQVIPSDGLTSVSLWDTTDPEALRQWLDENLGSDCITQVRGKGNKGAPGRCDPAARPLKNS